MNMHEIKPHSAHYAELQARRTPTVDERFAALENAQTRTMLAVEALARKDSAKRDDDDRRKDAGLGSEKLGSERLDDARIAKLVADAVHHAMRRYDRKRHDAGAEPEHPHTEKMREAAEGQHEEQEGEERDDFLNLSIPIGNEGGAGAEADDAEGDPKEMTGDDRRDARHRDDSVSARLSRLERNTRSRVLDADYLNVLAEKQADWDRVAQMHGQRAGRPLDGERVESYDRRMARVFQKFSPKWQGEDLGALPASVILKNVGPEVRADAVAAAYRADPSPGALQREVRRQDRTGRWISEFVGPVGAANGSLAPFRMAPMRVVSINRRPND